MTFYCYTFFPPQPFQCCWILPSQKWKETQDSNGFNKGSKSLYFQNGVLMLQSFMVDCDSWLLFFLSLDALAPYLITFYPSKQSQELVFISRIRYYRYRRLAQWAWSCLVLKLTSIHKSKVKVKVKVVILTEQRLKYLPFLPLLRWIIVLVYTTKDE